MTQHDSSNEVESADNDEVSRRSVLASMAGIAAAGAAGYYATGSASADPSGSFPEQGEDPLLKIRADRVRLVPRTSDPNPTNGTLWYRGDL